MMKKISFLSLATALIFTISAFTFCSNGNAKNAENQIAVKAEREKAPAKAVNDKKTEPKKKNAVEKAPTITTKTVVVKDDLTWYTDLEKAHAESEATGKPILGFFTGSDWCGWCFKLHDNVLVKEEFKTWAKENVVLMEIDFPRRTALDPELKAQNDNLQRAFSVSGFPTVWYFTAEKNAETGQLNLSALGKTGYPRAQPGGEAKAFIAASDAILVNNVKN